jgi:hypothetical protein
MQAAILIVCAALLASSCATVRRPQPLTLADIISMSKAGLSDEEIMRRIDQTRSVFRLSSDQILLLRNENVSARVIDYMLETYTRAMVEAERRAYARPGWHFSFGYFYYRR